MGCKRSDPKESKCVEKTRKWFSCLLSTGFNYIPLVILKTVIQPIRKLLDTRDRQESRSQMRERSKPALYWPSWQVAARCEMETLSEIYTFSWKIQTQTLRHPPTATSTHVRNLMGEITDKMENWDIPLVEPVLENGVEKALDKTKKELCLKG